MTALEVDLWLNAIAPDDARRLALLDELLANAQEDGMTAQDFLITRKARAEIQARIGTPKERKAPTYRPITFDDLFGEDELEH